MGSNLVDCRSIVAWDHIVRISSFMRSHCQLHRVNYIVAWDCIVQIVSCRLYRCMGSSCADCIVREIALCELHYVDFVGVDKIIRTDLSTEGPVSPYIYQGLS